MVYKINIAIIAVVSAVVFAGSLVAQNHNGRVKVLSQSVNTVKDQVEIDVKLGLELSKVGAMEQIVVTPVIAGPDNNTQRLSPVVVSGKRRIITDNRKARLSGSSAQQNSNASISGGTLVYHAATNYSPWMQKANVYLEIRSNGCGSDNLLGTESLDNIRVPERPVFNYVYSTDIPFITPVREEIKKRAEAGEAFIAYKVGKDAIQPELGSNRDELAKVVRNTERALSEPSAVISAIYITSYASPEGDFNANLKLSQRRSAEFAKWFGANVNLGPGAKGKIINKGEGEDWDGLTDLIRTDSVMTEKERGDILGYINDYTIQAGRERRIMAYNGGRTYKYMLDRLYPQLRRTKYRIEYSVPEFTVEKSREIFKTRPDMLSLAELHAIAGEHEKGSEEFINIYNKAVELYPDDIVANLNASAASLSSDRLADAREILSRNEDEPRAWIYLAILSAKEGDVEKAGYYIGKAQAAGMEGAEEQARRIRQYREAYDAYRRDLEEWQKYQ